MLRIYTIAFYTTVWLYGVFDVIEVLWRLPWISAHSHLRQKLLDIVILKHYYSQDINLLKTLIFLRHYSSWDIILLKTFFLKQYSSQDITILLIWRVCFRRSHLQINCLLLHYQMVCVKPPYITIAYNLRHTISLWRFYGRFNRV